MSFKSFALLLASLTISASIVTPVLADATSTPKLDKKEARAERNIDKGVKSGQLTTQEAADLNSKESKLKADEAAAKADGKVTKKERKALHHEANQNAKEVRKFKHNADKAAPAAETAK